jgi:prophage tail gpP-like protein
MANGQQPAQKAYFPYLNRAVLEIDGAQYYEWESVSVRAALFENTRTFRFTASEKEVPPSRSAMRIRPGQKCTVLLDGFEAVNGEVVTRQVYFDANQHVVEIQGQGKSGRMRDASVVSQSGEFNNVGLDQLLKTLAKPFGVGVEGVAQSFDKFKRVSVTPGESPWELGERHSRAANTVLSETPQGNIQMGILSSGEGTGTVIEGWNILEGREVIHSLVAVGGGAAPGGVAPSSSGEGSDFTTLAQKPGNDDEYGTKANQINSEKPALGPTDFNQGNLPKVNPMEIPASGQQMAGNRSIMDAMHSATLQIWVNVTLLGWQRNGKVPPSGGLWYQGDMVTVNSPMLILMGEPLRLKAVTWSQDNTQGTRSHLELVNELALGPQSAPRGVAPKTNQPVTNLTPEQQQQIPKQPPPSIGTGPPPETGSPARRTWSRPR